VKHNSVAGFTRPLNPDRVARDFGAALDRT